MARPARFREIDLDRPDGDETGSLDPEILARIRAEMASRNLTQRDVCERARAQGYRLSQPSFNRILHEGQDPRSRTLRAIAAGIGIPLRELMAVSDEDIPLPREFGPVLLVPWATYQRGRFHPDPTGRVVEVGERLIGRGQRVVAYTAPADDLEGEVRQGDVVFVDPDGRQSGGKLVVFTEPGGESPHIGQGSRSATGRWTVFTHERGVIDEAAVVGTVLGLFRRFDPAAR